MSRSQEVQDAVGLEGVESLERKRERLRKVVATPSERDIAARELMAVETEIAERDRVAVTDAVAARVLAIKRAFGSLAVESEKDNDRLLAAAGKFAEQVTELNARFEKCIALRHEAQTLAEVFGLATPELPQIVVPGSRKAVQEAFEITSRVGVRDNGFVQRATDNDGRRTFVEPELAGTPGLELIQRKLGR